MSAAFEPHELDFRYGTVLQAEALYCTALRYEFPIGFIWYSQILVRHVNVGYIFVHERFRRQGLATRMLNALGQWYPDKTICTAVGNELSRPWLVATGFTLETSGWFLRPELPCPMI